MVFHSDHGELLGDHGLTHKGCRFYEGSVRVPLIWSLPGTVLEGRVVDEAVGLIDIAPTLAEIAGLQTSGMQGESLLPFLYGNARARRMPIRCEFHDAIDMNAPTAPRSTPPCWASMLVEGRHKLAVYHGSDYGELYDLAADPRELDNRWDDPACAELRAHLLKRCFDAAVMSGDPGMPLVGRY